MTVVAWHDHGGGLGAQGGVWGISKMSMVACDEYSSQNQLKHQNINIVTYFWVIFDQLHDGIWNIVVINDWLQIWVLQSVKNIWK